MKFGFFDEPDVASEVVAAKSTSATNLGDEKHTVDSEEQISRGAAHSVETIDTTAAKSEAPVIIMPLLDVIANAKVFAREK
jgi:hypothetical protein